MLLEIPTIKAKKKAYVREYPWKILPYIIFIWYSTSRKWILNFPLRWMRLTWKCTIPLQILYILLIQPFRCSPAIRIITRPAPSHVSFQVKGLSFSLGSSAAAAMGLGIPIAPIPPIMAAMGLFLSPPLAIICCLGHGRQIVTNMAVGQNLVPLVNPKIAGKWMFIPLKMVLIGIDP